MKVVMFDDDVYEEVVKHYEGYLEFYIEDKEKCEKRGFDCAANIVLERITMINRVLEACKNCSETVMAV